MADPTLEDVLDAIATLRDETKTDFANLRAETKADFVNLRVETKADFATLRDETRADIASLRIETRADFASIDAKIEAHRRATEEHRRVTEEHRRETAKRFTDLDRELSRHADPVHRKLEGEIAELRKLVTAKKATRPAARGARRG